MDDKPPTGKTLFLMVGKQNHAILSRHCRTIPTRQHFLSANRKDFMKREKRG
jgi:hypothetical protein